MKKNVFSRTLAVLASTAVLGAASMISASAAQSLTISDAEGKAGETVQVSVMVECDNNFESLNIVTNFDEALTAAKAKPAGGASVASEAGAGFCTVVAYGSDAIADGAVATIDFTIPEDAQAGDTYTVEVTNVNTFAIFEGDDIAETVPVANGTITVLEDEEPTTEETTEPTTAETTEATTAATTTEAPTTTTAAPTTGAPKTGNAGVAVAVAGLVAAGATAVVLKKRH
ncbi:MAG: NPXTG-anchored protein [Oscillospiraceae bacterium]|nr:NPXTG-anchored protein [Oscillospiraceae bacterium]